MQRKAATVYFVFFVVVAAGAYGVIAVAEEPAIDVSGETYQNNDTFTKSGQQYRVTGLSASEGGGEGGGHGGGGGGTSYSGKITWTNQSFQYTATLGNNSTVSHRGGTYRVLVPNRSNVSQFQVREEFNVTQRLKNDSAVENQTVTREDGRKYVVYRNGTTQPLDQYLPDPQTGQFSEGDRFQYGDNQTTVRNVSSTEGVELTWTAPKNQSVDLSEGANVTLANTQYTVHFRNANTIVLTEDVAGYQDIVDRQGYFQERVNGLWAVTILSSLSAILVAALAFLPHRG